jgi:hypothetical protein
LEEKKRVYKAVQPHTKAEAELALAQGTREQIIDALLGVTYYVGDWRWVQNVCLGVLASDRSDLYWNAIQCLGHLATFHHTLDLDIVLPAIQAHENDPVLKQGYVINDALDDIAGVYDTSYFEENWSRLPQRIKDALIESGSFNNGGKHIRKRDFMHRRQPDEIEGELSPDQKLLALIKQRCHAPSDHDWQEYYDEQGRLQRLSLEDLELRQLPAELWQFTELLELDLSGNQLSSLPDEIEKLINLEWLALCDNEFSELPAVLFKLINVQELFLETNKLNRLPAELGNLINLQTLDLSDNQLNSLPAELGNFVNLLTLYLDKNQLRTLPAELGKLLNLRTIFLRDNQLDSLPAEIGKLANLRWLSLDGNQLHTLPREMGQLGRLDYLSLDENPQLQPLPPPSDVVSHNPSIIQAYLRAFA